MLRKYFRRVTILHGIVSVMDVLISDDILLGPCMVGGWGVSARSLSSKPSDPRFLKFLRPMVTYTTYGAQHAPEIISDALTTVMRGSDGQC